MSGVTMVHVLARGLVLEVSSFLAHFDFKSFLTVSYFNGKNFWCM